MKNLLFVTVCFMFIVCSCGKPTGENQNTNAQPEVQLQETGILNSDELFNAGKIKFQNNDFKGAIADFTKSLEMREVHHVRADLGRAKEAAGDLQGALEDYTKAIEQQKRAFYYEWRASLYTKLGKTEEAKKDMAEYEKLPKE